MTEAGRRIGSWALERPLGAGGSAQVWLAHRADAPSEQVAVKILRPHHFADALAQFEREARILQGLDHPAIVRYRTHGTLEVEELCYLVMDLVEGEDLSERLARGPLDPSDARRLFRDLSAGLAHAHGHGIFHRDLKPQNVRVRPDGSGVLIDFGIAFEDGGAQLTRDGLLPGTIGYFPPEIFDRGGRPDPRLADVYALGLLLYEALEGRAAYPVDEEFSTQQQSVRIIAEKMEHRRLHLSPDAPTDLADLVEVATHPSPSRRLPSMALFHERLGGGVAPAEPVVAAGGPSVDAVGAAEPSDPTVDVPPPDAPASRTSPVEPAPDPALDLDRVGPAAPADGPVRAPPASEGRPPDPPRAGRPPWLPIALGAAAVLLFLGLLAGVASTMGGPSASAPAASAPTQRTAVAVDVPQPVDGVRVAGVAAVREADGWKAEVEPGTHEVVIAVGDGCDDGAGCGPCCACARHSIAVGLDPLRTTFVAPAPPPPVQRTLHVRVTGAPEAASISAAVDGQPAEPTAEGFTAVAISGGAASLRVDVGACEDPHAGCALTDACPPGCWSTVLPVEVTCDVEPLVVPVDASDFEPEPEPPPVVDAAPQRARVASPGQPVAPEPPEPAMHVRVVGEKLSGGIDAAALQQALQQLADQGKRCWRRSEPPWATMPPADVDFKVRGDGTVDPSSVEILRGTGDNLLDACLRATVRDASLGSGMRSGRARATFHLTVE